MMAFNPNSGISHIPNLQTIRACPICHQHQAQWLHTLKFCKLNTEPAFSQYHLVSCLTCQCIYADVEQDQHDFDQYYQDESHYEDQTVSSGGDSPQDIKRFEQVAARLLPYKQESQKILDIGCANGGLLSILKKAGFTSLAGLDPSKHCVTHVSAQGLTAYHGSLFDLADLNQTFDLVILSHVLEHVRDAGLAIDMIQAHLNPEGLLYIEVPDAGRYDAFYKSPFYYFDQEHINHFDSPSLSTLLERHGMETKTMGTDTILVGTTELYPVLYGLFQKNPNKKAPMAFSKQPSLAFNSIQKSLQDSTKANAFKILETLCDKKTPIWVWGAGQFTQRLLAQTPLGSCILEGFVDNNKSKQGKRLVGKPIISPAELSEQIHPNATLIIATVLHQQAVYDQLQTLNLPMITVVTL
jgi:2-polyprenyl-3-methyl-5-hydroxy-6-metoxy-1,4-benzoquinol methylase